MDIRVDGWRSGIRFDAAHVLPYHEKCGRLHGHTYALHATVRGDVAGSGFIMDFGDVKRALKAIADRLDHHFLIQTKSPHMTVEETPEGVRITFDGKTYLIPAPDALLLPIEHSTAETLARYVASELVAAVEWPATVREVEVGVDESYGKGAWTTITSPADARPR